MIVPILPIPCLWPCSAILRASNALIAAAISVRGISWDDEDHQYGDLSLPPGLHLAL
jgi:hypothetical protein